MGTSRSRRFCVSEKGGGMSGLSRAIEEAFAQRSTKAAAELRDTLRENGAPRNIWDVALLRRQFRELSGAEFDDILSAANAADSSRRQA